MRVITTLIFIVTFNVACKNETNNEINDKLKIETIVVRKLTDNHWQTYTDIVIDAPIEKVWKVLTDWNNISNWSSSLTSIDGKIQNGGKVIVSYSVDGNTYKTPHTLIFKEMEEFGWSDIMEDSFKGLKDNHRFRVEKISDNQTRFIQSDDFQGLGNKEMTAEKVANMTVKFFPLFNRELKNQVEK